MTRSPRGACHDVKAGALRPAQGRKVEQLTDREVVAARGQACRIREGGCTSVVVHGPSARRKPGSTPYDTTGAARGEQVYLGESVQADPMEGREFARQMGLWIWPGVIAEAAGELRDAPQASQETAELHLFSRVLQTPDEAALTELVEFYLDHFFIPDPVLRVAEAFWASYFEDDLIRARVRKARFHGAVHRDFPRESPEKRHALLRIESTVFEVRLIQRPLTMLTQLVSDLADAIRMVPDRIAHPRAVHQELTHDGPLAVFVEAKVGQAYGLTRFGRAAMREPTYQIRSTPRRRSYYGPQPVGPAELQMMQALGDAQERPLLENFPDMWE